MKSEQPAHSFPAPVADTFIQVHSTAWVGFRSGLPPKQTKGEEASWRVVRHGVGHDATLSEIVTSDSWYLGMLLPATRHAVQGKLFLIETRSDLLLARVEANHSVRFAHRLVRLKVPLKRGGLEFRWAAQQGLRILKDKSFRITRHGPFCAATLTEALKMFQEMESQAELDIAGQDKTLNTPARDLELAKWEVQKDIHGRTLRTLQRLEEDESADTGLIEKEASKQFAIDVMARTGLRLQPIEQLTATQRKSLARRGRKVKNIALRQFVLNYFTRGYNKLHAHDLARIFFADTGRKMSPAALTKARERLGLTTEAAGRPPSNRK